MNSFKKFLQKNENWLFAVIYMIAIVGTLTSLYFSIYGDPVVNIQTRDLFNPANGLVPCLLCWYSRILFYPTVFISIIGITTKDKNFTKYIIPLATVGIILSIYHYGLQKLGFKELLSCGSVAVCQDPQVDYFGFITIPFMALLGYIGMLASSALHQFSLKK